MKGAAQICRELTRYGVTDVFGLLGDGNYRYLALLEEHGIAFHAARHESAAIAMADAYARTSGRLGVCTVTHGPGLTHALSSLVEVRKSQSPVVLLASDTPTWPTAYSCQDADQTAILSSIGLRTESVRTVGTLARDLARVLAEAERSGEPIAILIPTDVQDAECRYAPPTIRASIAPTPPPDQEIAALAQRLAEARRPLLLAGRGATRPDAREALARLATQADALLGTTALAIGLFADDPFSLGVVGGYAPPAIREILSEADLVLGFGTSFSAWTTLASRIFAPEASLIQIDRDPLAIARNAPVEIGIVADVIPTADALHAHLGQVRSPQPAEQRTTAMSDRIVSGRRLEFTDASTDGCVDPRTVMRHLDETLPDQRTVSFDGGWHGVLPVQRLSVPDSRGFVFSQTYQSIGLGFGAAIGAAIARPDRLSVLVMGDGGLGMSLTDFATGARCGRPILVVAINDSAYAAEIVGLEWLNLPTELGHLPELDFAAIARALGGDGIRVSAISDLERLRPWLAKPEGLFVLDCQVPYPSDYGHGGEEDWIEHIWHEPRRVITES